MEEIAGGGEKPVVYFRGKDKGLILNITNATMIEEITGTKQMDDWSGTEILLYPTRVDFRGKKVLALRVDHSTNGTPPRWPRKKETIYHFDKAEFARHGPSCAARLVLL